MNKKYALVSIVLIALMSLSLIPMAAKAAHTPCSSDDGLFEDFGPRPSLLLIREYTDYAGELEGFKNKEVDVMDWALEPIDYQWFAANDPNHEQYATAFYTEFGAFQYDINGQVAPTDLISVRRAFAHILDKQYFINTYLAGMAHKLDSCLGHLPGWFNPAVTDLYNLQPRTTLVPFPDDPADWETAYDYLVADLGPPIPDPERPGFMTWTWPTPFPDPSPSGLFGPLADGHLLFFARSEMGPRSQQGYYFKSLVEDIMPVMLEHLGKPPAELHVDLYVAPKGTCRPEVMMYYRYHLYSGGWILGRDPDFLVFYTSAEIIKPEPNGNNYVMYANPDFDDEVDLMLTSAGTGTNSNPCDGVYHAWAAQVIMEADEPVIWFWSTAGYKAYLSNWAGVINQAGFGTNSWWTFMNAHKIGSESCDTIRYGWQGDLLSLNIIGATFYWDYEVLGKVYDTLISVNPYNVAEDRYWMASWEIGTWAGPDGTASKVTFHLREDMWWQDVPYNPARTVGGGHLNGPFTNMQVTPVDVAFSMEYHRDNINDWSQYLADPISHVGMNSVWSVAWPWTDPQGALPPWWSSPPQDPPHANWQFDFVQFDDTLNNNDIVVYLNVFMPWLALHWIGGLYILPMHIWEWIGIWGSELIDVWAEDLLYGSGPWILLDRAPGTSMTMIPFRTGEAYRGIVLQKTAWMALPVRVQNPEGPSSVPGQPAYTYTLEGAGTTGKKVVVKVSPSAKFKDYDYALTYAHDIQYQWSLSISVKITWISGTATVTGAATTTIKSTPRIEGGASYTTTAESDYAVVVIPTGPDWCYILDIQVSVKIDLAWHIHSCWVWNGAAWVDHTQLCNFVSLGGLLVAFLYVRVTIISLHFHPADIAGASPVVFPYLGSDGICSIKDATLIGLYWMQVVPAGTDPTSNLARADINGDGIVSIKDATLIGLFWMRTWP